jgi:hypothetical protein
MSTMLVRTLSALGLTLALAACGNSGPEPVRTEPVPKRIASLPSPIRVWRSDDATTRTILLTIYDDDSATLLIRRTAETVLPEKLGHASLARVGDRTFLIFFDDYPPEVAEIADRLGDRLVVWFHHDLDFEADIMPQLGKLPRVAPSAAVELILVPEPDQRKESSNPYTPATRFVPE